MVLAKCADTTKLAVATTAAARGNTIAAVTRILRTAAATTKGADKSRFTRCDH